MLARSVFLAALASSFILAGCSGSSTAPTASGTPATSGTKSSSANPLVGKWKGSIDVAKSGKDDGGGNLAEALAKMFGDIDLEIKDGDRFSFTAMGMVSEGAIATKDKTLTLTPDHIMGMTIAEFKKMSEASGKTVSADAGKPMTAEVSADGTTISLLDEDKPDQKMVFKRSTEQPRVIGPSTVTPAEAAIAGNYKAEVDESKVKPADLPMAKAMLSTAKLSLDVDNTFTATMILKMEGKWKVDGDKVTLTVSEALGVKTEEKQKPITMSIKDGRLVPLADDKEAPPLTFVKQ